MKLCFQQKFDAKFVFKNDTLFNSKKKKNFKKNLKKWHYLPSKEKELIQCQFFRGFLKFTKNLDFSTNRIYRINQLALLFSGLLTLRFSDIERVLISGTLIVSEPSIEEKSIELFQLQIENAKNVSSR